MSNPPPPGDGGLRGGLYGQVSISGQRLSLARRLLYRLAAPLAAGLVRLWWWSCRIVVVVGEGTDEVLARFPSFFGVLAPASPVCALPARAADSAHAASFLIVPVGRW
jgi:hypothetical protein